MIMLELTVAWKVDGEEANKQKRTKYQELMEECRKKGGKQTAHQSKQGVENSLQDP